MRMACSLSGRNPACPGQHCERPRPEPDGGGLYAGPRRCLRPARRPCARSPRSSSAAPGRQVPVPRRYPELRRRTARAGCVEPGADPRPESATPGAARVQRRPGAVRVGHERRARTPWRPPPAPRQLLRPERGQVACQRRPGPVPASWPPSRQHRAQAPAFRPAAGCVRQHHGAEAGRDVARPPASSVTTSTAATSRPRPPRRWCRPPSPARARTGADLLAR